MRTICALRYLEDRSSQHLGKREREQIWARLEMVDGVIPSLYTFFQDIDYLKQCVDCVKRLIPDTRGVTNTVSSSLRQALRRVPARECQVVIQYEAPSPYRGVAVTGLTCTSGSSTRSPCATILTCLENLRRRTWLRSRRCERIRRCFVVFGDLAARLGFKSDEITLLRQCSASGLAQPVRRNGTPYLVTPGPGHPRAEVRPATRRRVREGQELPIHSSSTK